MRNDDESISDRSRPVYQQPPQVSHGWAPVNTVTAGISENKRRKRGGRRVKRQQEVWKGIRTVIRVATLNIGTTLEGEKAGRLDRAKECRCIVPTRNKVERE